MKKRMAFREFWQKQIRLNGKRPRAYTETASTRAAGNPSRAGISARRGSIWTNSWPAARRRPSGTAGSRQRKEEEKNHRKKIIRVPHRCHVLGHVARRGRDMKPYYFFLIFFLFPLVSSSECRSSSSLWLELSTICFPFFFLITMVGIRVCGS